MRLPRSFRKPGEAEKKEFSRALAERDRGLVMMTGMNDAQKKPELLAPAGEWEAMAAAVEAGADAVYLGLRSLNARQRAKNFNPEEFEKAAEWLHARGKKLYLTLNIDLTQRELGQTARVLALAQRLGVDAVLARDPAVLLMRKFFPGVPVHFSTQACVANTADVRAAAELGVQRVVLARELSLAEIAACSRIPLRKEAETSALPAGPPPAPEGNAPTEKWVETEVFVQGALCFCVSGRCLLSSWGGGRSGNRGQCTSPCRVPWTVAEEALGTPLSMKDLALVDRIPELAAAGVSSLKIEGRLKTAAWVGQATALYRQAVDAMGEGSSQPGAGDLGAYTGRAMTDGYLDGERQGLTGLSGREATSKTMNAPAGKGATYTHVPDDGNAGGYRLSVQVTEAGIVCQCSYAGRMTQWSLPKTVVRREAKAVPLAQLEAYLRTTPLADCRLAEFETNAPEFLLVPRAVNALQDQIMLAIRRTRKAPDDTIRLDLPGEVRALLELTPNPAANKLSLGSPATHARLQVSQLETFLAHFEKARGAAAGPAGLIAEGVTVQNLAQTRAQAGERELIAALPQVFYEQEVGRIRSVVEACAAAGVEVEVNTWGGWWLAKEAGAKMSAGPGLGVLNALALLQLSQLGCTHVTLALEADKVQLEEMTAHAPAACSVVVFGRPVLMFSRVELSSRDFDAKVMEDRRGTRVTPRREEGMWVIRPEKPFDWRGQRNSKVKAARLVADLTGSGDPWSEWRQTGGRTEPALFNYDRTLA